MADAWHGPTVNDQTLTFGPLALIAPLLERLYRQSVPAEADGSERHRTTESLLRAFRGHGLIERATRLGRVVHATCLTSQQARILKQLGFPTPAKQLAQVLAPLPLG